ncbi:MAG: ABC transporter substrate-binding protein [Spirochaetia bacterium]|jgi:peptide/nickel transport system substrate-binding protein|nr:ABC transporter substrate-binding protein [Spirochaetia bacterium]
MKKLLFVLLILLTAASVFAGGKKETASEKVLRVGVPDNPMYLDPGAKSDNVGMRVIRNIHETLIEVTEDGTIIPRLAESWKQIDARTIEFTLRKDIVSHKGFPFNADDVLVSYGAGRVKNPEDPCYEFFKQFTGLLESVVKVDDYTVRITKAEDDPLLLLRFTYQISAIICGDSYKTKKSWEEWMVHPVGFGPYYVDEYKPDEYLTIRKFDDFYGEKAPVDIVKYIVIPEMAPRIMGLISKDYDIITEVMPDQFSTIENKKGFSVLGGPINNVRVIVYDTVASPVLANPKVRLALNYSIDRELINNTLFKGISEVPKGIQMKNFGKMYINEFKPVGYNPEKAKQLLKEAGYKGEEINYRYMMDYYTGEVATAQILQQMWSDVGLNVKIDLKENWSQIEEDEAAKGRGIVNWSATAIFPDPLTQIARLYGPAGWFQVHNWWKNDEFNKQFEILSGTEPASRRKAAAAMLDISENIDPPGTYLYLLPIFYGKSDNVKWETSTSHFMDFRAGKIELAN